MRALFACALLAAAACAWDLPKGIVEPFAWPTQSIFTQIGYDTASKQTDNTTIYYDAVNWRWHQVNHGVKVGLIGTWWLGNDLYMIEKIPVIGMTCQKLEMGFGIPVPDWFLTNSTPFHTLYQSHKHNSSDPDFYKTLWTRKYATGGVCANCDAYFNYFSEGSTGAPFKLYAPSPTGEVVNEFYNWEVVSGFSNSTFELPSGVKCTGTPGSSSTSAQMFLKEVQSKALAGEIIPDTLHKKAAVVGQLYAMGHTSAMNRRLKL